MQMTSHGTPLPSTKEQQTDEQKLSLFLNSMIVYKSTLELVS